MTDHERVNASTDSDERSYAVATHLVGLVGVLDGMGLLGLLATVILWRIKASESAFIDDHGREAVNFQISLLLYGFLGAVLFGLLVAVTCGAGVVAFPLIIIGVVVLIVLRIFGCVRAAIVAGDSQFYRYPMTLRIL